jgi:hypothetical protein
MGFGSCVQPTNTTYVYSHWLCLFMLLHEMYDHKEPTPHSKHFPQLDAKCFLCVPKCNGKHDVLL